MSSGSARGRPRNPLADRAILDATVAELSEGGFDGLTVESVAAAAGVSRPTVYRRYPDRHALIRAAVSDAFHRCVPEVEETADPLENVLAHLRNTAEMLVRTPVGPLFRALVPRLSREPDLGRLANELGLARRRRLAAAMARARQAGALPSRRDLDAVIDGLTGAIYFRYLITGRSLDEDYLRHLLEELA